MSSSRWPRIVMATGPSYAGVHAGDALPFPPDWWLFISTPIRSKDGLLLSLHTIDGGHTNGTAWRYSSGDARFQKLSYDGGRQHWVPCDDTLRFGDEKRYQAEWVFRFVDDGPAVTVARRFGPYLCVNPRTLGYEGYVAPIATHTSRWTWVRADGSLGDLVVTETRDDARTLSWHEAPRHVGPSLFFPKQSMRCLDREIAKAVVSQMTEKQPASWIDFAGVVHSFPPNGSSHGSLASLFWQLTGRAYTKTDEERAAAQAELDATPAAARDDVARVIRALFPDDWAREQHLREECGALRIDDVEDGTLRRT